MNEHSVDYFSFLTTSLRSQLKYDLLWRAFPCSLKVKVTQSCVTLCDPMDCTVPGILQARILEWVAIPFSRESSQAKDRTHVSRIAGRFFTSQATREALLLSAEWNFVRSAPWWHHRDTQLFPRRGGEAAGWKSVALAAQRHGSTEQPV